MKELLSFLRDLENNNNREWFQTNKERYLCVQKTWNTFCENLIQEIGTYDPDIARLTLRECTYRIYRDTRFSKDKTPYKTHFGVFLAKGGKKSMHAGYYFHIGTGTADTYPHAHMLAAGNYCYDPRDAPYAVWMRMKSYCMVAGVDDAFITQDHLAQRVAGIMQPTKPFIDYINRAVDYVNEEMSQEY